MMSNQELDDRKREQKRKKASQNLEAENNMEADKTDGGVTSGED